MEVVILVEVLTEKHIHYNKGDCGMTVAWKPCEGPKPSGLPMVE